MKPPWTPEQGRIPAGTPSDQYLEGHPWSKTTVKNQRKRHDNPGYSDRFRRPRDRNARLDLQMPTDRCGATGHRVEGRQENTWTLFRVETDLPGWIAGPAVFLAFGNHTLSSPALSESIIALMLQQHGTPVAATGVPSDHQVNPPLNFPACLSS